MTKKPRPLERAHIEITPETVETLYALCETYPNGVDVRLSEGHFQITRTVKIPSNFTLTGKGPGKTKLEMMPHSNCHLFTNSDWTDKGNDNIVLRGFSVEGNSAQQEKPEGMRSLTFCCAIYMRQVRSILVEDCTFHDIRQTAAHFTHSAGVIVRGFKADGLGWSGVSTTNSNNVWVEDCHVSNAGGDVMHSAIHIDGGLGVYIDAHVSDTTGNGVMLDSLHAHLVSAIVKGSAKRCRRGVSLSGASIHDLRSVYIEGDFSDNSEVGVMVSNSSAVAVAHSRMTGNGHHGILFQGKNGGRETVVVDCEITGNEIADIKNAHASHGNWVFTDPRQSVALGAWDINGRRFDAVERPKALWHGTLG